MRNVAPIKTDLIIGMTLAEMFLLILFVVWYSQGAGAGPEWEKIAKQHEAEIQDLKAQLDSQKEKVLELERLREWWRKNFRTDPPASMEEVELAFRSNGISLVKVEGTAAKSGGRSNLTPKCSEVGLREVLFGTVIRGRDLYEVDGKTENFDQLLNGYERDLNEAHAKDCRYSVKVSFQQSVGTGDFVTALRRLRTVFYVQLQ